MNFTCWTNQGHDGSSKCNGGLGDLAERDAGIITLRPVLHALDILCITCSAVISLYCGDSTQGVLIQDTKVQETEPSLPGWL